MSGVQSRPATESVLWELAFGPGGVLLDRAGAVISACCSNGNHVRLDGPAAARADRAALEEGLDQATACDQLHRDDRTRTACVRLLHGRDPRDPKLYHLVIDTTVMPVDTCVDTIVAVVSGFWDARR